MAPTFTQVMNREGRVNPKDMVGKVIIAFEKNEFGVLIVTAVNPENNTHTVREVLSTEGEEVIGNDVDRYY